MKPLAALLVFLFICVLVAAGAVWATFDARAGDAAGMSRGGGMICAAAAIAWIAEMATRERPGRG